MNFQDPWRYRCPEGHASWERQGETFYCRHCDKTYQKLTDWQTKQQVDA